MNIKKTTLCVALGTALSLSATASPVVGGDILYMNYTGLFTMLNPGGRARQNTSSPYYGDATWGYGFRTQISGSIQLTTTTGAGSVSVNPFQFSGNQTTISSFNLQAIGDGAGSAGPLMLGNMLFAWGGEDISAQLVLNGSGLFDSLFNGSFISVGDVFDASTCAVSGACATPASNDTRKGSYPIGPTPIATTSFNTLGQTGAGTTLGQLSLGTDDFIGGSPMDNGTFSGSSVNFDFTSITMSFGPQSPHIPVPAAIWLFGSGLLGLVGLARRRKTVAD